MTRYNTVYFYLSLALLFVFLDYFTILSPLKTPIEDFILPLKQNAFESKKSLTDFIVYIKSYNIIGPTLHAYDQTRKELLETKTNAKILEEENERIRIQLGAPLPASYQFMPAQVLTVAANMMEIKAGELDGIKKDMTVLSGTTFVGKIQAVSAHRSFVMLPSHPDISISAKTSKDGRGIIHGQVGGGILLDRILQKDPVFLEDSVLTAGDDGIGANLVIGTVVFISTQEEEPYKQAKIKEVVSYDSLKTVFVVTSL